MTTTHTCRGCGRADFKKAYGLTMHLNSNPECAKAHNDGLATVTRLPLEAAGVETFDPNDFRVVGAVAEFNPEHLHGKSAALGGKPVRVTKVNPKTVVVETVEGQRITTDVWLLIPTDKEFVPTGVKPITALMAVRITGKVRLGKGAPTDGIWITLNHPTLDGKVRIGRLGDGGRYYTLPTSMLTPVDAEVVER